MRVKRRPDYSALVSLLADVWQPADVMRAAWYGVYRSPGYVYRGLGLCLDIRPSPKGRRPGTWTLMHLGSGHSIVRIVGDVKTAFPIASEIAEAGDWNFDSMYGWKDRFPEARDVVISTIAKYPKVVSRGGSGSQNEDAAREIAIARAA